MKKTALLLIITCFFSCQSETKKEAAQSSSEIPLAYDPEDQEKVKPETTIAESKCGYNNPVFSIGKGLVMVNSNSGNSSSSIELYNDSLLQEKYISWNYYEKQKPGKPVCPKYFNLEPDVLHFVYLKETAKSYQVLNGFNEIKYLPKVKANVAESWEDHILTSYAVGKLSKKGGGTAYEQPFRKEASENAAIADFPKDAEMLCPLEIKGDWVKVKFDCFNNGKRENSKYEGQPCHEYIQQCKPAQTGWIKWREKNKILIDIFLMP